MGRHLQVSAICSMLLFLLLFSMRLAIGFAERKGCSSFCGMQNISYPFRLKGDRKGCGYSQYQLICEGNKTVFYMESNKYYVTEISYENHTINLVDSRLASGNCCLPFRSLSARIIYTGYSYDETSDILYSLSPLYGLNWATFVNCTRQIKNDTYRLIPCLSQHDAFVSAVLGEESYELQYVEPSCRFLATVPMAPSTPEMDSMTDIFKLLQKGFVLSWSHYVPPRNNFQICLREVR